MVTPAELMVSKIRIWSATDVIRYAGVEAFEGAPGDLGVEGAAVDFARIEIVEEGAGGHCFTHPALVGSDQNDRRLTHMKYPIKLPEYQLFRAFSFPLRHIGISFATDISSPEQPWRSRADIVVEATLRPSRNTAPGSPNSH